MKQTLSLIALIAAVPALAEDSRQMDAHEHGVGALNIAIDGATIAMEFDAPGADIVGFEYAAESDADLAAIDAAVATLGKPLDLFVIPEAAACTVTEAQAELESGDGHDEHDEEHHDDHAGEEDHAEEDHDGHDDHGDEEHDEHAEEADHTEFHAEYTLTCENPDALTEITFAYFETFPNAKEVEVQIITASGAQAFEVERDAPMLDLGPLN
ncbi:zinc uptake protein ZrgA [Aliiroseovarius sp. YM-037]|uniref:zinc uptake protein ZrgA n=1 Tax=Aliiroseovarius sp. YM-037 TaxID=3341728 RepID=UPI003A809A1A